MAIISGSEVQSYCGLSIGDDDTYFDNLASAINIAIAQYCGRGEIWGLVEGAGDWAQLEPFSQQDAEEIYSGDGTTILLVQRRPIISITHIKEETSQDVWEDINTSYYQSVGLDRQMGRIEMLTGVFNSGNNNYKVRYTAGWSDAIMPKDLKLAAKEWGKAIYEDKEIGNVTSRSLGPQSGSITMLKTEIPDRVKQLLLPYRKPAVY